MKKYFGMIVLAIFLMVPMFVNAGVRTNFSCSDHQKDEATGQTYELCTISLNTTAGETVSNFEAKLELTNVTLDESSLQGAGGFTKAVALGDTISFTADTAQSGETINVGSFKVIVDTTKTECHVKLIPTGLDNTTPIEVDATPVETVPTGSSLPIIAIGIGVMLLGATYFVSRKNTKMYRI